MVGGVSYFKWLLPTLVPVRIYIILCNITAISARVLDPPACMMLFCFLNIIKKLFSTELIPSEEEGLAGGAASLRSARKEGGAHLFGWWTGGT